MIYKGLPDYQKILGIISVIKVEDNEEEYLTNLIVGCKLKQTEKIQIQSYYHILSLNIQLRMANQKLLFLKFTT